MRPILYNLTRLEFATTVVITEGEKDADRVTNLKLCDAHRSEIVATTSGGSDIRSDALADPLRGKRVIVMPDSDEAGSKYKEEVMASLEKRHIEVLCGHLRPAEDVSEYLDAGDTGEELAQRIADEWTKSFGQGDVIERPPVTFEDISI